MKHLISCLDNGYKPLLKYLYVNTVVVLSLFVLHVDCREFFWFYHILFNTSGSRPSNNKGTASSMEGVVWTSPTAATAWHARPVRARSLPHSIVNEIFWILFILIYWLWYFMSCLSLWFLLIGSKTIPMYCLESFDKLVCMYMYIQFNFYIPLLLTWCWSISCGDVVVLVDACIHSRSTSKTARVSTSLHLLKRAFF